MVKQTIPFSNPGIKSLFAVGFIKTTWIFFLREILIISSTFFGMFLAQRGFRDEGHNYHSIRKA